LPRCDFSVFGIDFPHPKQIPFVTFSSAQAGKTGSPAAISSRNADNCASSKSNRFVTSFDSMELFCKFFDALQVVRWQALMRFTVACYAAFVAAFDVSCIDSGLFAV